MSLLSRALHLIFAPPSQIEKGGWSPDKDGPRTPPEGPCCIPARPSTPR